jgi:hypothetical protein
VEPYKIPAEFSERKTYLRSFCANQRQMLFCACAVNNFKIQFGFLAILAMQVRTTPRTRKQQKPNVRESCLPPSISCLGGRMLYPRTRLDASRSLML